jgi:hypothetical protein
MTVIGEIDERTKLGMFELRSSSPTGDEHSSIRGRVSRAGGSPAYTYWLARHRIDISRTRRCTVRPSQFEKSNMRAVYRFVEIALERLELSTKRRSSWRFGCMRKNDWG